MSNKAIRLGDYPKLCKAIHHWPVVWQTCLESWLQSLYDRSGSQATISGYTSVLAQFFSAVAKNPNDIVRTDVEIFAHKPLQQGPHRGQAVSVNTISYRLTTISSWYQYAASWIVQGPGFSPTPLYNKTNPCLGLKRGQSPRSYKSYDLSEIKRLFTAIRESAIPGDAASEARAARDLALYKAYLYSGRRKAELLSLTWGDIQACTFDDGNGGRRQGWRYAFSGKGYSRQIDYAELSQEVYDEIVAYLTVSGRLESIQDSDPLWIGYPPHSHIASDPFTPLAPETVTKNLHRYARIAGISPQKNVHSFRHTNALNRAESGEPIRSIQRQLRHASIATTDRYLAALLGSQDDFLPALRARFGEL